MRLRVLLMLGAVLAMMAVAVPAQPGSTDPRLRSLFF